MTEELSDVSEVSEALLLSISVKIIFPSLKKERSLPETMEKLEKRNTRPFYMYVPPFPCAKDSARMPAAGKAHSKEAVVRRAHVCFTISTHTCLTLRLLLLTSILIHREKLAH